MFIKKIKNKIIRTKVKHAYNLFIKYIIYIMTNSTNNQIDMNYHLSCYWIISSHNTYLQYGQIGTRTSTCYYNLLLQLYKGGFSATAWIELFGDNRR